jgi:hypothetical protein
MTAAPAPTIARAATIRQQYHLDMDLSSIPRLIAAYGLTL